METRANYFLIGVFTLAGLVGLLGFFLWFAQVELDRQFDYYDIRFSSVAGLGNASDVRFSGLPVGQVVDVRLSPDRDGTILVRIEVAAETPVRTDSIATIEAQGVTGVAFVGLGPGSPEAPLLEPSDAQPFPEITAGRSTLQMLTEDAPRLLQQSLEIIEGVGDVLGEENRARIDTILSNIEAASGDFAQTLEDFSDVTSTVGDFAGQINRFNETLDTLAADLSGAFENAETTLAAIGELTVQGKDFLSTGTDALNGAQSAIASADSFVTGELSGATQDIRQTAEELRSEISDLGTQARALLGTLGETGETATARLTEAEATLQAANALIARLDDTTAVVGRTATSLDGLLREDASPLLAETRALVAEAQTAVAAVAAVATDDLPVILSDVQAATRTVRDVTAEVGAELTGYGDAAGAVIETARGALEAAETAFGNANETLGAINTALETGDRALVAAERAFAGADRVINEDLSGITAGLDRTLAGLDAAIREVSDTVPVIAADLRAASTSAASTFAELRRVTGASAPAVQEFMTTALPLYARLAQESRALIGNLDRLAAQVQRNPARFFLDSGTPEFRR